MTAPAPPKKQPVGVAAAAILAAAAIAAPLVATYEGTVNKGYADPVGIPTACTGHTGGVVVGKPYTDDQCMMFLVQDLAKHGAAIAPCINRPIPDKTRAAFTSFAFNVGPAAFCKSTMARKVNAGDLAGACAELSKWVNAGGKPLPGLVKRRWAERAFCEAGLYDAPNTPTPPKVSEDAAPAPAPYKSVFTVMRSWFR